MFSSVIAKAFTDLLKPGLENRLLLYILLVYYSRLVIICPFPPIFNFSQKRQTDLLIDVDNLVDHFLPLQLFYFKIKAI